MPSNLSHAQSTFVERLRNAVASDERFNALLIGGSYIHGGMDEHSDLDFVLVVEEDAYADVMTSRMAFAKAMNGFISAFTGEHVGEPRLLICLYGPPLLHVDLKFVLPSDLDRQIERQTILFARSWSSIEERIAAADIEWPNRSPEWFEARAWIWMHYAITKLARGELYEAIGMLGFFREQVLGPMLYRRAGKNQRGVRRIEALGLDEKCRLAATVANHDTALVKAAITASIDLYLHLRADHPPSEMVEGMPKLLLELMDDWNPAVHAIKHLGTVPE